MAIVRQGNTTLNAGAKGDKGDKGDTGDTGEVGPSGVQMTDAEVKTAYENNADTNAFTDAEKVIVGNTSGTNTGDQVIPVTGVDFDPVGTDNSTISSIVTGEPTGSSIVGNVVQISQVDYDAAVTAVSLVATTLYVING